MELTVVGAGPAYTNSLGATGASYLVRVGETTILLDLGQGSFPRLASEVEPSSLEGVFISHLHPDHFIDLVPLRHYLRYHFHPPRRVRVFAPRGLDARLDCLHDEPGFVAEALDMIALEVGARPVGGLVVEAGLVTHTDESYGFRVAADGEGPGLVYSGDCGRAADLAPLIRPGDALLIEVSLGEGPMQPGVMHLNADAVGTLASASGAGRVLLTHIGMSADQVATIEAVRARFAGPVELVEPGSRLTI